MYATEDKLDGVERCPSSYLDTLCSLLYASHVTLCSAQTPLPSRLKVRGACGLHVVYRCIHLLSHSMVSRLGELLLFSTPPPSFALGNGHRSRAYIMRKKVAKDVDVYPPRNTQHGRCRYLFLLPWPSHIPIIIRPHIAQSPVLIRTHRYTSDIPIPSSAFSNRGKPKYFRSHTSRIVLTASSSDLASSSG